MGLFRNLFGGKSDNAALLRAIENVAAADNPQNWTRLYRLLLDCVLFIPVREIPRGLSSGAETTDPVDISLLQLTDNQQKPVTTAFTDEDALRNWDPNTPFLGIKSREYFRMVKGTEISAIVINPFDPIRKMLRPGGRIARFEFEALAEGLLPDRLDASAVVMTLAEGKPALLGAPANPPSQHVLEAVAAAGRNIPEVKELYLFQMSTADEDSRSVVGVDWSKQPEGSRVTMLLESLTQSVHPLLTGSNYLDFVVLDGAVGEAVRKCGKKLLEHQ